ncbi:MAG: TolC family protein [Pseudomonadota bacterium]
MGSFFLNRFAFTSTLLFVCVLCLLQTSAANAQSRNRGVVILNPQNGQDDLPGEIRSEILAILADVKNVKVVTKQVPESAAEADLDAFVRQIYNDPSAAVVVVADVGLNQAFARRQTFSKPTILPFVFDSTFNGLQSADGTSGVRNLAYTAPELDLVSEFQTFTTVAPIRKATLVSNARVIRRLNSAVANNAINSARTAGFELSIQPFDNSVSDLLEKLPTDTDAVFLALLPDSSTADIQALLPALTARGIATYAISNERYVTLGALASNAPSADATRIARRTAVHVFEILSGTPASTLPVSIDSADQLTINMATARALNISPSFDVLSTAKLINNIEETVARIYSLTQVARLAVDENLALMAQRFQAQQAKARIAEARGQLLPQVSADVSFLQRRETTNVRSGFAARNSTDGSITLTQSIFTEEFWAAYAIQKYSALSERALLREVELDIIQSATQTYLSVLREKTSLEQAVFNLDITRENLRLARNRVSVGTEDASDLYRWQSEQATAQQAVLASKAAYEQLRQQLNQILNRPIKEPFGVTVERLENPDLLITDGRITQLISNAFDLAAMTDYFVELGLERSPELTQAQASIDSSNRQLRSDKRQLWMPDVSVVGNYSNNFDEAREMSPGGFIGEDDWSVTVQASIPLFEGGSRYSRIKQSRLAVRQSKTSLQNTENQIEQDVRNAVEALKASFTSIPLAKEAEVAAEKNYKLVSSAYAQGKRDIINVLDAQDSLISAREAALNAVFNFLIDLMNTQRAIGGFDFFLDDRQKLEFSTELTRRVEANRGKQRP